MGVISCWLRVDVRHRWRSMAILALLVALSAATILAALAGARRGLSAQSRLARHTLPATTAVLANTPGFDWGPVERLPEVAALTRFVVDYSLSLDGAPSETLTFPPGDDATGRTIERPVIFAGRMFDPDRADEVVVSRRFASRYHKGVGSSVVIHLPTEAELMRDDETPPFHGPSVRARIVGVVESPWFSDTVGSPGVLILSPGLAKTYPNEVLGDQSNKEDPSYVNALVRLHGGEAAIPQFRRDLARVTRRDDLDVWDLPSQNRELQRNIAFESWCLVVFAAIAFAAAVFLVGQAISRFVEADAEDLRTLQALGVERSRAVGAATAAPALAGIAGAVVGVGAAYVASGWFPIGTAGLIEPSPGRSLDILVLGLGVVATVLLVVAAVGLSARRALGDRSRSRVERSPVTDAVARGGWPVSVVIGTRFALQRGRGRDAVPVRPAVVGAVIGVLGITAAFTFSSAVNDAASKPERFGQTFQAGVFVGINSQDFGSVPRLIKDLNASHRVTGVLDATSGVVGNPSGSASVTVYTYQRETKPLPVVLTSGRLPTADDEVVLAPVSMTALHAHVGGTTTLVGSAGSRRFKVTGTGFVPSGPHNSYSDGAWVTRSGFAKVVKGFKFDVVLVSLAPTSDVKATAKALAAEVEHRDPQMKGIDVEVPDPLQEVAELHNVQRLPVVLGAFLVVLALGAVGHALVTSVRRRSRDLAVLRAMGLTPGQCRRVVIVQSTLLGLLGLVIGLPLGLAVGRLTWQAVAAYTPLQYVTPLAGWGLPLLVPAALLAVNLLGLWPSQRAAKLRIADVLRVE
jgi:ABC-type lipoprotein release transport system permease subunit